MTGAPKLPPANTPCDDVGDWFAAPLPAAAPKKRPKG